MNSPDIHRNENRVGLLGYYWFLTFEQAPELHALTKECQTAIDGRYFDLTPVDGLHLTLDRIAYNGGSTPERLSLVASAAREACRDQRPFTVTFDRVTNLRSAIGFNVSPIQQVRNLRDTLRAATLSVSPDAPVKVSASDPHVTIAYPSCDETSAADAAATAERINATIYGVDVTIAEVAMVLLERHMRGYSWKVVVRIPLV